MKITKNTLLYTILILALIANISILCNLQIPYLRNLTTIPFLTFIPGFLLLMVLKKKIINFWESLIYSFGGSLAIILFLGLLVNTIFPTFGIEKPLTLMPLILTFDITLFLLWIIAHLKHPNFQITVKQVFNRLSGTFFISLLLFPILSILGARSLNNHGTNFFTMLMLAAMSIYILLIVRLRSKLTENIYPISIYLISLSLLSMYSLRSWHISGWDIMQEYYVFRLTKISAIWNIKNFIDPYNTCLSITILPTIMSIFTGIKDELLIKIMTPLFFSFVPLIMYLTGRRYVSAIYSFLASFFFVSQWMFMNQYPYLQREQIALVFASLIIYTLFNKNISHFTKQFLLILFGYSLVVSHYSSTYIMLILLIVGYVLTSLLHLLLKLSIPPSVKRIGPVKSNISVKFIMAMLLFIVVWYVHISYYYNVGYLGEFLKNNIATINLSVLDLRKNDANWYLWKVGVTEKDIEYKLSDYVLEMNKKTVASNLSSSLFPSDVFEKYSVYFKPKTFENPTNAITWQSLHYLLIGITLLVFIFMFIGILKFLVLVKKRSIDLEYVILALTFAGLLGFTLIMPTGVYSIGPLRVFQQSLILLSLAIPLGGEAVFMFFTKKRYVEYIAIVSIIYFCFYSTFFQEIVKGKPFTAESYNLANNGLYYNFFYTQEAEVKSANWIAQNKEDTNEIFADEVANLKLKAFAGITNSNLDILPSTITKDAYVYLSYNNTIQKTAYKKYLGKFDLNYTFPLEFLADNKNLIYNNGSSEIYK